MALNNEEMADIVFDVERKLRYRFDIFDIFNIVRQTIRKTELNRKSDVYIPILLENELCDFVMRLRINQKGEMKQCAESAI